jgi:hypothetical protein
VEFNIEETLKELNRQNESFINSKNRVQSLFEKQTDDLQSLIFQFKPIFDWYKDKGVRFSHPNLDVNSTAGPILGADQNLNYVIVYNIREEKIEKVNLHNEKREGYLLYNLVREGHFRNAVLGITYLTVMLKQYNAEFEELELKLIREIEEA